MTNSYEVVFSETARDDLAEIVDGLARYYPSTAREQLERILHAAERLRAFPLLGEAYPRREPYRRLVVDRYLIFYTVNEPERTVCVTRVIYGGRDLSGLL